MRKTPLLLLCGAILFSTLLLSSCTETNTDINDNEQEEPTVEKGLYSVSDTAPSIDNVGGSITITFLAMGSWSASSDSEWCTLESTEGESGNASITFKISPNPDFETSRTSDITISIEGYLSDQHLCQIYQGSDVEEEISGNDVNLWMSAYMTTNYLWNDEFIKIKPQLNYYSGADAFLSSALSKMNNIDEDGNYYANGERYYYTYLTTYGYSGSSMVSAPATRAVSSTYGYGINMLYPVAATSSSYYLLIASVTPSSPADFAGLKRGMYITKYNGEDITGNLLDESYYTLMDYTSSTDMLSLGLAEYQQSGSSYKLVELDPITISPASYSADPIIFEAIYQNASKSHTIGHLVYSQFDMSADDLLIDSFEKFKSYNITDLILDLRYNGGGDVYASTVMASAVAGSAYQGEVYCHMQFNDYRTACGDEGYFYIGQSPSMVDYPLIEEAMGVNLGLERVYIICTSFTASAAELVINGLRGLDIEVILVGDATEGKNVGMEVISSKSEAYAEYDFGEYIYEFAPITFYNLNAKGFKDFSDGFTPDYQYTETADILFDWDLGYDVCVNAAVEHIISGSWPASASAMSTTPSPLKVVTDSNLRPISRGSYIYKID